MDTPYDRQARRRTPPARDPRLPADRRATAQGDGLLVARQPQEARRCLESEPRPAVPAHHRLARALRRRQQPPHQRRYEEEGARRHVPQSRRQVGPQPRTRQRPRLPLRRRRPRRALRHLRPSRQCRHRLRRQNRRHPGVRRRLHREVVAHRGPQALSRSQDPADPGRRRRQQQLHGARLEVQSATSLLQPARLAREGSPLPARHVEVEPHRTPPVLRDQQELGGPTPRQLRDHPEVLAHHTHLHRTEGPRPLGTVL